MSAVVNPDPAVVTVWSDIGCPWATLALHVLHKRARSRDRSLLIDHRAFPLELFNRRPTPKGILDVEVAVIASHFPDLAWIPWVSENAQYPVTVLPALEAVQAAKAAEVGGLAASDELDTALRYAFYGEARCISIHPVILEVAKSCSLVDADALGVALAAGRGRADVFRHWEVAMSAVRGSPHVFHIGGFAEHNPGVTYQWTAQPGLGFPRLEGYDDAWADTLLDALEPGG